MSKPDPLPTAAQALQTLLDRLDMEHHHGQPIPRSPAVRYAIEKAQKVLAASPDFTPTHRHRKRGIEVQKIGIAVLQTAAPVGDNTHLALYRERGGDLWARPIAEFIDGRFQRLEEPA